MSKCKRYILLGMLAFLLISILVLILFLNESDTDTQSDEVITSPEDSSMMPEYTVDGISTELGDLTVYDVTVDGEPYKLVKVKGKADKLISYEEYYSADEGDTE